MSFASLLNSLAVIKRFKPNSSNRFMETVGTWEIVGDEIPCRFENVSLPQFDEADAPGETAKQRKLIFFEWGTNVKSGDIIEIIDEEGDGGSENDTSSTCSEFSSSSSSSEYTYLSSSSESSSSSSETSSESSQSDSSQSDETSSSESSSSSSSIMSSSSVSDETSSSSSDSIDFASSLFAEESSMDSVWWKVIDVDNVTSARHHLEVTAERLEHTRGL